MPGSYYIFALATTLGLPGARGGNIGDVTYPLENAMTFTGMFLVE